MARSVSPPFPVTGPIPLSPGVSSWLAGHGFGPSSGVEPLDGGNRHRVMAVERKGCRAVLKLYEVPSGGRDAMAQEMAFHGFVQRHLAGYVPALIASDRSLCAGLFGWLEGRKLPPTQVDATAVGKMADFLVELNRPEILREAECADLPLATDAGFGRASHVACASARLRHLLALPTGGDETVVAMQEFVRGLLLPELQVPDAAECGPAAFMLSPSDFGFHNMLVAADGRFRFFDFEHAGWDDPAKLAADFSLQPECPLDEAQCATFLDALERSGVFGDDLAVRVKALLPVQKVKWTAVILNVFHFPHMDPAVRGERLRKAKAYWHAARGA
jgi:hypothetical protein